MTSRFQPSLSLPEDSSGPDFNGKKDEVSNAKASVGGVSLRKQLSIVPPDSSEGFLRLSSLPVPQFSPHYSYPQTSLHEIRSSPSNPSEKRNCEAIAITPRQDSFSNPNPTSADYPHQNCSLTPITSSFFQDSNVRSLYTNQNSSGPMLEAWNPSDLPFSPLSAGISSATPQHFDSRANALLNQDSNSKQDVREEEARLNQIRADSCSGSLPVSPSDSGGSGCFDNMMTNAETMAGHSPVEREGLKEEFARIWLSSTYKVSHSSSPVSGTSTRRTVKKEIQQEESNLAAASPINRSLVYSSYCLSAYSCQHLPVAQSIFGKIMKRVHPSASTRRFGSRNASKYCYVNLIPTSQEEIDRLASLKKETEEGKDGEMVDAAKKDLAIRDRSRSASREHSPDLDLSNTEYSPIYRSKRIRVDSIPTSDSSISLGADSVDARRSSLAQAQVQACGVPSSTSTSRSVPYSNWYRERFNGTKTPESSPGGASHSTFQSSFQHRSRTSSVSSYQSSRFEDSAKVEGSLSYTSGTPGHTGTTQNQSNQDVSAYVSLLGRDLPHNILNQLNQRHHPIQLNELTGWPVKKVSELDAQSLQVWREIEQFIRELVQCGEVGQVKEVCDNALCFWQKTSAFNQICTSVDLSDAIVQAMRLAYCRIVLAMPLQQLSEKLNHTQLVQLGHYLRRFASRLETVLVERFFPPPFIKRMGSAAEDLAGGLESSISTLLAAHRLSPSTSTKEELAPLNQQEKQTPSFGDDYFSSSLGLSNINLGASSSGVSPSGWNLTRSSSSKQL